MTSLLYIKSTFSPTKFEKKRRRKEKEKYNKKSTGFFDCWKWEKPWGLYHILFPYKQKKSFIGSTLSLYILSIGPSQYRGWTSQSPFRIIIHLSNKSLPSRPPPIISHFIWSVSPSPWPCIKYLPISLQQARWPLVPVTRTGSTMEEIRNVLRVGFYHFLYIVDLE